MRSHAISHGLSLVGSSFYPRPDAFLVDTARTSACDFRAGGACIYLSSLKLPSSALPFDSALASTGIGNYVNLLPRLNCLRSIGRALLHLASPVSRPCCLFTAICVRSLLLPSGDFLLSPSIDFCVVSTLVLSLPGVGAIANEHETPARRAQRAAGVEGPHVRRCSVAER